MYNSFGFNLRVVSIAMLLSAYLTLSYYIDFIHFIQTTNSTHNLLSVLNLDIKQISSIVDMGIVMPITWFFVVFGFSSFVSTLFYPMVENAFEGVVCYVFDTLSVRFHQEVNQNNLNVRKQK